MTRYYWCSILREIDYFLTYDLGVPYSFVRRVEEQEELWRWITSFERYPYAT